MTDQENILIIVDSSDTVELIIIIILLLLITKLHIYSIIIISYLKSVVLLYVVKV